MDTNSVVLTNQEFAALIGEVTRLQILRDFKNNKSYLTDEDMRLIIGGIDDDNGSREASNQDAGSQE